MKLLIGVFVSFLVGAGCRYFDIPVPSPPVIPGALLVLAMTIGYSSTNRLLNRKGNLATTAPLWRSNRVIRIESKECNHLLIAGRRMIEKNLG